MIKFKAGIAALAVACIFFATSCATTQEASDRPGIAAPRIAEVAASGDKPHGEVGSDEPSSETTEPRQWSAGEEALIIIAIVPVALFVWLFCPHCGGD